MDSQVDLFIIKLVVCCVLFTAICFSFSNFLYTDDKGKKKKKSNQSIKKSKTFIKTCTRNLKFRQNTD